MIIIRLQMPWAFIFKRVDNIQYTPAQPRSDFYFLIFITQLFIKLKKHKKLGNDSFV
jgi:hypothetical protein